MTFVRITNLIMIIIKDGFVYFPITLSMFRTTKQENCKSFFIFSYFYRENEKKKKEKFFILFVNMCVCVCLWRGVKEKHAKSSN